jgi:hypothetical protein
MDAAQDQIVAGLSCYLFKIHFYTMPASHALSRNSRARREILSICTLWCNLFIGAQTAAIKAIIARP